MSNSRRENYDDDQSFYQQSQNEGGDLEYEGGRGYHSESGSIYKSPTFAPKLPLPRFSA